MNDWIIPMRWPAGWQDSALDLLKGTFVSCLVVDRATEPLMRRAKEAGLDVVSLSNLPASVCLRNGVWPGIRGPGSDAPAGPTGIPWVDSNGWLIRLNQTLARDKTIWVAFDPPGNTVLSPDSYVLALTDAKVYGGQWVISLDSVDTFRQINRALGFFELHAEWRSYQPVAALGVVSDFSGPNEFLGGETLNLLARRHQPYRIFEKARVSRALLGGLKAVLYVDQDPPVPQLRQTLLAFAASGGLLIVPPNWSVPDGAQNSAGAHPRYRIYKLGGGRIAIAKQEVADPYLLAADSHLILSHRNDLVRIWNADSTNSYYLRSPDGKRAVVEVINYATSPGHLISLRVMERYRQARFLTLDGEAPMKAIPAGAGTEVHLPPFSVYAAIQLEK